MCNKDPAKQVEEYAAQMLGNNLITKQTTAEGLPCTKVMLAECMDMKREMYISIMLDRSANGAMFIASPAGGTSIEDVAEATPELIFKQPIDIMEGVTDEQSTFLATSLGKFRIFKFTIYCLLLASYYFLLGIEWCIIIRQLALHFIYHIP